MFIFPEGDGELRKKSKADILGADQILEGSG
jgi:hypothetical protein